LSPKKFLLFTQKSMQKKVTVISAFKKISITTTLAL
jgi:hypothetical protein